MRWVWILLSSMGVATSCTEGDLSSRAEVHNHLAPLHACSSNTDSCDDGDLCTQDACDVAEGACRHQPITGCCLSADDCDDRNECTEDRCVSNVCSFTAILGCEPLADAGGPRDAAVAADGGAANPDGGGDSQDAATPRDAGSGSAPDGGGGTTAPAPRDGGPDAGRAGGAGPAELLDIRGGACTVAQGAPLRPRVAHLVWLSAALLLWRCIRRVTGQGAEPPVALAFASSRKRSSFAGHGHQNVDPHALRAGSLRSHIAAFVLARAVSDDPPEQLLRRRQQLATVVVLAALAVLAPVSARAQDFRLDHLRTPALPEDLFWLERADPSPALDGPFLRLGLAFADDPLVAAGGDPPDGGAVIAEQLATHLSLGLSALERVHVALGLPFWTQRGDGVQLDAEAASFGPPSPAIGDPALDLRVHVLPKRLPVELALAMSATIPIGTEDAFASDDGPTLWPRAILSVAVGAAHSFVGLDVGVVVRPDAQLGRLHVGHELRWAAGGQLGLGDQIGVGLELAGSTVLARAFEQRHTPVEATASVRYADPTGLAGALGLGAGLSSGYGAPDARVLATLGYRWSPCSAGSTPCRRAF